MGISIGIVGLGSFGGVFAELFAAHPAVDRIAFCDSEPERVKRFAENPVYAAKFNRKDAYFSLDEICNAKPKLDALAIITQPWLHAPQCIQAMEAGMDVYSAVPVISLPSDPEIMAWCDRIIQTSLRTGKHYMLGETTCFRPQSMFCRRKALAGEFGDFVYAEGEYCHDLDCGCSLRQVQADRTASLAGSDWPKREAEYAAKGFRITPMGYPTHSVSGPIFCMNTRALKVSAYGYRNANKDPFFQDYDFSNVTALYHLANGASLRIAEMRECCGRISTLENEVFRIMGTRGSFSENVWYYNARTAPETAIRPEQVTVYKDIELFDRLPTEVEMSFKQVLNPGVTDLHNIDFVPQGHGGSHPYLVHEFVSCVIEKRQSLVNPWEAAHYMAMGVAANESARKDGELVKVVDWGRAPEN